MPSPTYYQPSGRFSIPGVATLVALSSLAAAVGGALYGAISQVNPFVYVNILGGLAVGFGVGVLINHHVTAQKIRSRLVPFGAALFAGLVCLYFAWIFYLYVLTVQAGEAFWAWNPVVFISLVLAILENGVWSIGGDLTPTGGFLAVLWLIEAAVLVGIPLFTVFSEEGVPFCEQCAPVFG